MKNNIFNYEVFVLMKNNILNNDVKIYFWIGTIAEYIKMMPIAKKMQEEKIKYKIIAT